MNWLVNGEIRRAGVFCLAGLLLVFGVSREALGQVRTDYSKRIAVVYSDTSAPLFLGDPTTAYDNCITCGGVSPCYNTAEYCTHYAETVFTKHIPV